MPPAAQQPANNDKQLHEKPPAEVRPAVTDAWDPLKAEIPRSVLRELEEMDRELPSPVILAERFGERPVETYDYILKNYPLHSVKTICLEMVRIFEALTRQGTALDLYELDLRMRNGEKGRQLSTAQVERMVGGASELLSRDCHDKNAQLFWRWPWVVYDSLVNGAETQEVKDRMLGGLGEAFNARYAHRGFSPSEELKRDLEANWQAYNVSKDKIPSIVAKAKELLGS